LLEFAQQKRFPLIIHKTGTSSVERAFIALSWIGRGTG
jgi:hypothetical protein